MTFKNKIIIGVIATIAISLSMSSIYAHDAPTFYYGEDKKFVNIAEERPFDVVCPDSHPFMLNHEISTGKSGKSEVETKLFSYQTDTDSNPIGISFLAHNGGTGKSLVTVSYVCLDNLALTNQNQVDQNTAAIAALQLYHAPTNPSPVENLTYNQGGGFYQLGWEAPIFNGNSPIEKYIVKWAHNNGTASNDEEIFPPSLVCDYCIMDSYGSINVEVTAVNEAGFESSAANLYIP